MGFTRVGASVSSLPVGMLHDSIDAFADWQSRAHVAAVDAFAQCVTCCHRSGTHDLGRVELKHAYGDLPTIQRASLSQTPEPTVAPLGWLIGMTGIADRDHAGDGQGHVFSTCRTGGGADAAGLTGMPLNC